MENRTYSLAMGQMLVEGGQLEANLGRAAANVQEAARRGCEAVVLPECLDLGWTHPSAWSVSKPIPGPSSDVLCQAAADARIHVVAGLTERDGDRLFNAAILVSPEGKILLKHRKINILSGTEGLYSVGRSLSVAETSIGVVGVNICADNFSDSLALGHSLARMGAQVILSPCAWAVPSDHDHRKTPYGGLWWDSYSTLARTYDLTVVGVSNVGPINDGPWVGRRCIGCSLAVGTEGETLAVGPYGEDAEALIEITVELEPREELGTGISQMLRDKGISLRPDLHYKLDANARQADRDADTDAAVFQVALLRPRQDVTA